MLNEALRDCARLRGRRFALRMAAKVAALHMHMR